MTRQWNGRRRLIATGIALMLALSAASGDVAGKAADKVGQDPTVAYDDGRAAEIMEGGGRNAPYEAGISFTTGAIFKFHPK